MPPMPGQHPAIDELPKVHIPGRTAVAPGQFRFVCTKPLYTALKIKAAGYRFPYRNSLFQLVRTETFIERVELPMSSTSDGKQFRRFKAGQTFYCVVVEKVP